MPYSALHVNPSPILGHVCVWDIVLQLFPPLTAFPYLYMLVIRYIVWQIPVFKTAAGDPIWTVLETQEGGSGKGHFPCQSRSGGVFTVKNTHTKDSAGRQPATSRDQLCACRLRNCPIFVCLVLSVWSFFHVSLSNGQKRMRAAEGWKVCAWTWRGRMGFN